MVAPATCMTAVKAGWHTLSGSDMVLLTAVQPAAINPYTKIPAHLQGVLAWPDAQAACVASAASKCVAYTEHARGEVCLESDLVLLFAKCVSATDANCTAAAPHVGHRCTCPGSVSCFLTYFPAFHEGNLKKPAAVSHTRCIPLRS